MVPLFDKGKAFEFTTGKTSSRVFFYKFFQRVTAKNNPAGQDLSCFNLLLKRMRFLHTRINLREYRYVSI